MNLKRLFANIYTLPTSAQNITISALYLDSRLVKEQGLFIACQGENSDGSDYIVDAIANGACGIVREGVNFSFDFDGEIAIITVPKIKALLPQLISIFYAEILDKLTIIAVTGTNGKTSIAYLLANALNGLYAGTLGLGKSDNLKPLNNTTPHAIDLLEGLKPSLFNSIPLVIEASSHGLKQDRLAGLNIEIGIFTNLTHEHLDYHQTMDAYAEAKFLLFTRPGLKHAIVNIDCPWGEKLASLCLNHNKSLVTVSLFNKKATIYPEQITITSLGLSFFIKSIWGNQAFKVPLVGQFNVANLMAVIATLAIKGNSLETIAKLLETISAIPGRMEIVAQSPCIIVDYAHTPDALENALQTCRQFTRGKLWCVFGCGGDRDKQKRPQMGEIAVRLCDHVILTNDNPRFEAEDKIIDDIEKGISPTLQAKVVRIQDRRKALAYAIKYAHKEDVILIAGKGHENYQLIAGETFTFSDREIVKQLVSKH